MVATLIIIGIFVGFFFLVIRPLQKKTGNYEVDLPKGIHEAGYPSAESQIRKHYSSFEE